MSRKKIHLDKNILGHRIQMVLDAVGVGQDDAAKLLGISKQSLNRYINSRREPGINLIDQMGTIFKCSIIWLMAGDGEMFKRPDGHRREIDPEILKTAEKIRISQQAAEQKEAYILNKSPEIEELLEDARYVLTAGNALAFNALERNIKYFRHAVTVESEMKQLRAENAGIKAQINDLQAQFMAFKMDREVSDLSSLSKKSG
jgi:transcriptional regulator with XRE-family HTH domain